MFPVEVFRATLNKAVAIFRDHSIRFHLTGGITSVFYAEPRMTQDIDLVIDNGAVAACLESFLTSLATSDFMHDAEAVRHAVSQKGMFQLLDRVESLKLDVYARELIAGELDRSVVAEVFEGEALPIASRPIQLHPNWFGSVKEATRVAVIFARFSGRQRMRTDV